MSILADLLVNLFPLLEKDLNPIQRGQLILRFKEIIKIKRPRAFVIENVPGLAASKVDGKRLPDILKLSLK